jgi:hypothetical protein
LKQDTATGALVSVSGLMSSSTDSLLVTITPKNYPTGITASQVVGNLVFVDTAVSGVSLGTTDTVIIRGASGGVPATSRLLGRASSGDTTTGGGQIVSNNFLWNGTETVSINGYSARSLSNSNTSATADSISTTSSGGGSVNGFMLMNQGPMATTGYTGYVGARFRLYLETYTTAVIAGTYTFTVTATPYTGATAGTAVTSDVSIVVSAVTAVGSGSTAYLGTSTGNTSYNTDTITAVSTADNATYGAVLTISLTDGTSQATGDTVTVTTNIGNVGLASGTAQGKAVQFAYNGAAINVGIFPDGTAGTASVCATTTASAITFPCRTLIFYSTSVSTISVTPLKTTLAVGSNSSAFIVKALDASGNWISSATATYTFSSATGVVSDTATASTCTVVVASAYSVCSLTGVAAGTASIVVGSNTNKANATTAFTVTVTNNPIASIAIQTNKSSYAPGEKAYVRVVALDSAGKSVAPQTIGNFFATGGITTDVGLGANSDALTSTSVTLTNQTTTGYATGDAVAQFTVYMPSGASSIKFSATGGSGLPTAAQKDVSLTVTVADSGSQALAAVTALASQVSAFITKINAQITTLTDLVMKIQKKVKA